jgi:hypothetical protein
MRWRAPPIGTASHVSLEGFRGVGGETALGTMAGAEVGREDSKGGGTGDSTDGGSGEEGVSNTTMECV